MAPTISATSVPGGKIRVSLSNVTLTSSSLIYAYVTDSLVSTSDSTTGVKILQINPLDDNDMPITSFLLDQSVLVPGRIYHIAVSVNGDVSPAVKNVACIDLPVQPNLQPIARDSSLGFRITNYFNKKNSVTDGFSAVTGFEVTISDGTDLSVHTFSASGDEAYSDIISIKNSSNNVLSLINGTEYEFVVRVKNILGYSPASASIVAKPADFPNTIRNCSAISESTWKQYKNDNSQVTGKVMVFFTRSDDFSNLNQKDTTVGSDSFGKNLGDLRITSSTVRRYKLYPKMKEVIDNNGVKTMIQDTDAIGNKLWLDYNPATNQPDTTDFVIVHNDYDAQDTSLVTNSFKLQSSDSAPVTYQHMYIDTTAILGSQYKYTVFSSNKNGDGVESAKSNRVLSCKPPGTPVFTQTTGDKKMTIKLVTQGSSNGCVVSSNPFDSKTKEVAKGTDPATVGWSSVTLFDVDRRETIDDPASLTTPKAKITNSAYLTKEYTFAANGKLAMVLIHSWGIDDSALSNFSPYATLYSEDVLLSDWTYTTPSAPPAVAIYAIEPTYAPITVNNVPGIKAVFRPHQVDSPNLGGIQNHPSFNPTTDIQYKMHTNSVLRPDVSPLYSEAFVANNAEYSFYAASPLGSGNAHYIRTFVRHPNTGVWLTSVDSTPPQSGNSITYAEAVTGLKVIRKTATTAEVAFNNLQVVGGYIAGVGSYNTDVLYRIDIIDMATNSVIWSATKTYTDVAALTAGNGFPISVSLGTGKGFVVSVVSQIMYNAYDLGQSAPSGAKRFDNVRVRKNYSTFSFVQAAAPEKPSSLTVSPMDAALYVNWSVPSTLNGTLLSSIKLFAIKENATELVSLENPAFPERQTAIQSVSGSAISETNLTQVWSSRANGINGVNAKPIVNDIENYSVSAKSVGTVVGGTFGSSTSYQNAPMSGVGVTLTINYSPTISPVDLESDFSNSVTGVRAYSTSDITAPVGLQTSSSSSSITATFDKDISAGEFEVNVDGDVYFNTSILSNTNSNISGGKITFGAATLLGGASGYTYDMGDINGGYPSGLFGAQQFLLLPKYSNSPLAYLFSVTNDGIAGSTRYNSNISVSDGNAKTISVRYAKRIGSGSSSILAYSSASTTIASAAIPPGPVSNPVFTVLNGTSLKLDWDAPSNKGGANQVAYAGATVNSDVKHKITVYTVNGFNNNNALLTINDVGYDSVSGKGTYTVSNLSQYSSSTPGETSYIVSIVSMYYQQQNLQKLSTSTTTTFFNFVDGSSNKVGIRLNAPPVPPVYTNILDRVAGQKAIFSVVMPNQSNYPIGSIKVYADGSATEFKTVTPSGAASFTPGSTVEVVIDQSNSSGLLNGKTSVLKFVPVPNYLYAQAPPSTTVSVTPRRTPDNASLTNPSSDNKNFNFSINRHGTLISNGIVIGKTLGSNSMQVLQLEGANWKPTNSGLSNSTDADNQILSHTFSFATPVTDVVIFVNHEDGTSSAIIPNNASNVFKV